MLVRPIKDNEKKIYNQVVHHPLQSWEWGEFRKQTGVEVERVGFFEQGKLQKAFQVTFHHIPILGRKAGYLPRSYMPDEDQIEVLRNLGKQHRALFVKIEPNVAHPVGNQSAHDVIRRFILDHNATYGRPLFTKYTFQVDLTQSEKELFANLHSKTRYNVRLAIKKGVTIVEDTSEQGMETYLEILKETTKRQGFYAHSPEYFRTMWRTIGQSGMLRIFNAVYEGEVLTSWVMFVFNKVLYYPYGASRSAHRNVMASNLMMWEMMRFGQKMKCQTFDMWGSLGPKASKRSPWYGFHKFKAGYGGELMEFLGSFDILVDPPMYQIYTIGDNLRWKVLKLKAKLGV
jgi:lipid II:glycine glycyltransferase (peptidoglycan interpeptide bridge formation enzyme)